MTAAAATASVGIALAAASGGSVDLALPMVDEAGHATTLGASLDGRPGVLVLGYLGCRDLCPVTVAGVVEALDRARLSPGRDYRAVFVTVDPQDTAPMLAAARVARIPVSDRGAWHFVSPQGAARATLASALGFRYEKAEAGEGLVHAAGFVVLTPSGQVAQAFPGVRFDAAAVRLAVSEAGRDNPIGTVERLVMLCRHLDPTAGRYTSGILATLRAVIGACAIALAVFAWTRLRRRAGSGP